MSELLSGYLHVAPFLALGVLFLLLNLAATLTGRSGIPLIGAACGTGACLMQAELRPYWWLFIVLDLGTLKFLRELPALLRREKRYGKRERLSEFSLDDEGRRVRLELFASGVCRLQFQFRQTPGSASACELLGRWKVGGGKKGRRLILLIEESEAGRYEFTVDGESGPLRCANENHPLAKREAAASLAGGTLELISGKLPKINPVAS